MQRIVCAYMVCIILFMQATHIKQPIPSHSWMSPKLHICTASVGGYGIFAHQTITKGEKLIVFGGTIMTEGQIVSLSHKQITYALQIDTDLWLSSNRSDKQAEDTTDYLNHRCDPNAGFQNAVTIIAMRDIDVGEEITIDYAMVVERFIGMDDFPCYCTATCCRKMIKGIDWQNPELQKKYHGYFSPYLQAKIDKIHA